MAAAAAEAEATAANKKIPPSSTGDDNWVNDNWVNDNKQDEPVNQPPTPLGSAQGERRVGADKKTSSSGETKDDEKPNNSKDKSTTVRSHKRGYVTREEFDIRSNSYADQFPDDAIPCNGAYNMML